MTVQELEIVQELFNKCTSKNISDELMYRLNKKWGSPNFTLDYKKHERILHPIDQVKEFYLENNLKFNLDTRSYDFIFNLKAITRIYFFNDNINIQAKASPNNFDTFVITKNGELIFIGMGGI